MLVGVKNGLLGFGNAKKIFSARKSAEEAEFRTGGQGVGGVEVYLMVNSNSLDLGESECGKRVGGVATSDAPALISCGAQIRGLKLATRKRCLEAV